MENQVEVDAEVADKARLSVQKMIDLSRELGL
jgi:quinolinate synthase